MNYQLTCRIASAPIYLVTFKPFRLFLLIITVASNGISAALEDTSRIVPTPPSKPLAIKFPTSGVTVECRSGAELVAAIVDSNVELVLVPVDVTMFADDWAPYGAAPTTIRRNLTISGAYEEMEKWPTLDFGFVKGKIRLRGADVSFNVTHLVLINYREAPLFQAPGLDLASATPSNPTVLLANITVGALVTRGSPVPLSTVWLHTGAVIQNTCLPPSKYAQSSSQSPRPPEVPGPQLAARTDAFPNCVNSSTAHPMTQCWVAQGKYFDMATYGFDVDPFNKQVPGDYILRVYNTIYLCERVMAEDCAERLGVLGCYLAMFPRHNISGNSPAPAPQISLPTTGSSRAAPSTSPSTAAESAGEAQSASGGSKGSSGTPTGRLVGIVVGTVVGTALLALVLVLTLIVIKRKRMCSRGPAVYGAADDGGAHKAGGKPAHRAEGAEQSSVPKTFHNVEYREGSNALAGVSLGLTGEESTHPEDSLPQGVTALSGPFFLAADPQELSLIPVTPLTPYLPGVKLQLDLRAEVKLLPGATLGAGTFGTVVQGTYGGEKVAVKFVKVGLVAALAEEQQEQQQQPKQQQPEDKKQEKRGGPQQQEGPGECLRTGSSADGPRAVLKAELTSATACSSSAPHQSSSQPPHPSQPAMPGERPSPQQQQQQEQQQKCQEPARALEGMGPRTRAHNKALLQEVEVLARCQHPNIIKLLAANTQPPGLCLVMELMDTSLERMLYGKSELGEALPLRKVLHISIQICMALSYLHPTILHRDLKPANVLIKDPDSDTPVAKLADFGLARLRDTVLLTRNPEVGTAPYMAPETFDLENNVVTDRVDIYSLGIILYELLAARRPWLGLSMVQVAYKVAVDCKRPPIESVMQGRCPTKLQALIAACWETDPGRRPAAAEVAKRLMLVQQEVAQKQSPSQANAAESSASQQAVGISSANLLCVPQLTVGPPSGEPKLMLMNEASLATAFSAAADEGGS